MKKYFSSSRSFKKFVHLSSVLFAVNAFSYSNVAFADVEGIPSNRDFPNAQYPYAQAPNGCSGPWGTSEVRDTWESVNFTGACDNHDRCYYTRGSNWNTCNERFYSDLRAACERDLRVWVPPTTLRGVVITPGFHTPPEPASLATCYKLATSYYAGVQAGVALNVFNEAQGKQRRYEEWVASVRNSTIQNRLYIRSFDGQTFGEVSASQEVSGADRFRGWSWNGTTASYVAFENGQSTLIVRPFDGRTFGPVSSSQVVSSSDAFRGWSWDGRTASYVTFKSGEQSTLIVRPFDGATFGPVSSSQVVSSSDAFRGWSWNGTTASYVTFKSGGQSMLIVRPFDGKTFGPVTSTQAVSDRDVFRGWSWDGSRASYVAK